MEGFWSYLSCYVTLTRNMAAATRKLTLTDGVRYFAWTKMDKIGKFLLKKWSTNEKLIACLESDMMGVSMEELKERWACVVVKIIDSKERMRRKTGLTTPRFPASTFARGKLVGEADVRRNAEEDLERYVFVSYSYVFLKVRICNGALERSETTCIKTEMKRTLDEMRFLEQVLNRVDCRPETLLDPLFDGYHQRDFASVEDRLLQFISTTAQGIHFRLRYLKLGKVGQKNLDDKLDDLRREQEDLKKLVTAYNKYIGT
ncbi:uncharacterized protein EV154DRAFT_530615 [Mucor mucedo]|uniref:uncharacterized protein n=1 Tax=Mucor mucedo TaxID=29922 RepID=UPI00221E660B|nr:uncharacterized protein EV154DRAFT_530615 [Mucor mucedo]KAI7869614.1 hypothetical protein EV154DRAFT_530615 [Mucor mucedo]